MRLFTAIELPDALKRRLANAGRERVERIWGRHARGTRVAFTCEVNLHVTLKFVGEVPEKDVASFCDALLAIPPTGTALALRLGGLELFPASGPVRIVAGAVSDAGELAALHSRVEEVCAGLGVRREGRAYRPHITLARVRNGLPAQYRPRVGDANADLIENATWTADAFVLMQSDLRPAGAVYTPIARFPLLNAR